MPVDYDLPKEGLIYQREQYQKGGVGRWYWDYRDRKVISCITDEEVILDIGCGEGITLEKLVAMYPKRNIKGVDPSMENIEICRGHNLPAESGNVCNLEIKDDSVDCCLLLDVIEHLGDPERALTEVHRVLKKGGILLLLFPNDCFFKLTRLITFKFREAFYNAGHKRQWTPGLAREALLGKGFRILKQQNLPFYFWLISLHNLVVAMK